MESECVAPRMKYIDGKGLVKGMIMAVEAFMIVMTINCSVGYVYGVVERGLTSVFNVLVIDVIW
jgi:hypothetical protein